ADLGGPRPAATHDAHRTDHDAHTCQCPLASARANPLMRGRTGPLMRGQTRDSCVGGLALGGAHDTPPVLVRALVGADLLRLALIALGQSRADLRDAQLVIARPGLLAAQSPDLAEDR